MSEVERMKAQDIGGGGVRQIEHCLGQLYPSIRRTSYPAWHYNGGWSILAFGMLLVGSRHFIMFVVSPIQPSGYGLIGIRGIRDSPLERCANLRGETATLGDLPRRTTL